MKIIYSSFTYILISFLTSCGPTTESYSVKVEHSEKGNIREISFQNDLEQFVLFLKEDGMPDYYELTIKNDTGFVFGFDDKANLSMTGKTFNGKKHGKIQFLKNGFIIREYDFERDSCISVSMYTYDFRSYFECRNKLIEDQYLIFEQQRINGNDSILFIDSTYFPQRDYDYTEFPEQ